MGVKMRLKKPKLSPDWCGSVGWALSQKAEDLRFDS